MAPQLRVLAQQSLCRREQRIRLSKGFVTKERAMRRAGCSIRTMGAAATARSNLPVRRRSMWLEAGHAKLSWASEVFVRLRKRRKRTALHSPLDAAMAPSLGMVTWQQVVLPASADHLPSSDVAACGNKPARRRNNSITGVLSWVHIHCSLIGVHVSASSVSSIGAPASSSAVSSASPHAGLHRFSVYAQRVRSSVQWAAARSSASFPQELTFP